jgi:hypothetical protein
MVSEKFQKKLEETQLKRRIREANRKVQTLAESTRQVSLTFYLDDDKRVTTFKNLHKTYEFAFNGLTSCIRSKGEFSKPSQLATRVLKSFEDLSIKSDSSELILLYSETINFLVELDFQCFQDHCETIFDFILKHSYSEPYSGAYILSKGCQWMIYFSKYHGLFEVITSREIKIGQ